MTINNDIIIVSYSNESFFNEHEQTCKTLLCNQYSLLGKGIMHKLFFVIILMKIGNQEAVEK